LLPGTIAGNSMWVGAVVGNARRQKTQALQGSQADKSSALLVAGHRPPLQVCHCHVGFDRVGNETILVSGVMHFVELFRTRYSIPAPCDLRV
jgi:hypothetical protein